MPEIKTQKDLVFLEMQKEPYSLGVIVIKDKKAEDLKKSLLLSTIFSSLSLPAPLLPGQAGGHPGKCGGKY